MRGKPHWLIVQEWDADCDDLFEVIHDESCETSVVLNHETGEVDYQYYTCGVEAQIERCGIDEWFMHRDDPSQRGSYYVERVPPGAWPIGVWVETFHGQDGTEYDEGLTLYPADEWDEPVKRDPNKPTGWRVVWETIEDADGARYERPTDALGEHYGIRYYEGCPDCDKYRESRVTCFPHHLPMSTCKAGSPYHCDCKVCEPPYFN